MVLTSRGETKDGVMSDHAAHPNVSCRVPSVTGKLGSTVLI